CIELQLDDIIAPSIIKIASHVKELKFNVRNQPQLSDPAAFIAQLDSLPITSVHITTRPSSIFFGLSRTFWENYLNVKLSSGSLESVHASSMADKVTK
ncbi:hypothetical protein PMAYCL1PPCAC_27452, partial [Pristionchus mayeri]